MNEERRQDYLNLIDALLKCLSEEEVVQVLRANWNWVDAEFLQIVTQVAELLEERGGADAAEFLIHVTHQLSEILGFSSATSALTFVLQVLKAASDSNGDSQVVYPLLEANLDKLDDNFAQLLQSYAMARLHEFGSARVQGMAAAIFHFSNLIQDFPLGNPAMNLEIAITGYEFLTTTNLDKAFPQNWAATQLNLGKAYLFRIWGKRAENLETAIRCFKMALKEFKREAFPQGWAAVQNNLGNAYSNRIRGERAENLETAINYYLSALQEYKSEAFPQNWTQIQNNLGVAYLYRIREEREENLEAAIGCFRVALKVCTCKAFPKQWATFQNNLGITYLERIRGKREKNIEAAIGCFKAALKVRIRKALPQDWATTQSNLGNAYRNRIRGKRTKNLKTAISFYLAALEVYTREDFPERWAATQSNLGTAYGDLIREESSTSNLEAAVRCYSAALEVRTRQALPQNHAVTQLNLGVAYHDAQQFRNAYTSYVAALDSVESLRSEIVSGDEAKQKLAEYWNQLYRRLVEVCLTLGNLTEAIEYAERSKTRNLVELIFTRDLHSIFPVEIVSQLEQLQDEIVSSQYQLQTATVNNPTALAQQLQQLRQQRNELQDRYLPIGYGFNFEKFQETLDDYTAIIQWYITSTGFETFIIARYSLQRLILPTPANDLKVLVDWANKYLDAYTQAKTQWINSLASRLSRLAEILHLEEILKLVPDTCSRLILIPHRYLHLFPLHALPLANGDFLCDRFPNGVGYAPSCQLLQLAQKREQHRDHFTRLLAIENPTRSDLSPLAGTKLQLEQICQHFDSDNSIVLREKDATEAALLKEQRRSPHCVHFCCHGSFNFGSPLKSALHLADPDSKLGADADLTLGKIFEKLNLEQCRLVTFSACETGIADPTSISDEYISLVSGFLYAGSPSVVSTLWAVQQAATNLFMSEFYKNLKQLLPLKSGSVAIALNKTQKWLRTLTGEELGKIIESPEFQRHLADVPENAENKLFKELLEAAKRKPFPYQNPYYWAAFVATGL
jgi:CHAT domain-containing protein